MAESIARARLAKVEWALSLRAEGLSAQTAACRVALSRNNVADWFAQPEKTLARARQAVEREDRRVEARRLRAEGVSIADLADRFGVCTSTVGAWCADSTGEKARARKAKYGGRCDACGGPTSYRRQGAARTCAKCLRGRTELEHMERNRSMLCGVPGCWQSWAEGRFVCVDHAPVYDRIRVEFERDEARGKASFSSQHEYHDVLAAA